MGKPGKEAGKRPLAALRACVPLAAVFLIYGTGAGALAADGAASVPVTAVLEGTTVSGNAKPGPEPSGGGGGRRHHDDDGGEPDAVTEEGGPPGSPIIPTVYLPGPDGTKTKVVRVEKAVAVEKEARVLPEARNPVRLSVSGNGSTAGRGVMAVPAGETAMPEEEGKGLDLRLWPLWLLLLLLLLCLFLRLLTRRRRKSPEKRRHGANRQGAVPSRPIYGGIMNRIRAPD